MQKYDYPDFDVTTYEVEDVITASLGNLELGGNDPKYDEGWFG